MIGGNAGPGVALPSERRESSGVNQPPEDIFMKAINIITLVLVIVGGLNWGLIGVFDFNLVQALFGQGRIEKLVYSLVGASAVYQFIPLLQAFSAGEPAAIAAVDTDRDRLRDRPLV